MQRLIKILQSYFLQSWTLSRPFYINHEIRCLPASYLFRLVINVQKKGTSLQYKIITHNYIHNSSLWQIPSFLFLLSFAFLLASFDFSYLDDIINCWSYEKIRSLREPKKKVYAFVYSPAFLKNNKKNTVCIKATKKLCFSNVEGLPETCTSSISRARGHFAGELVPGHHSRGRAQSPMLLPVQGCPRKAASSRVGDFFASQPDIRVQEIASQLPIAAFCNLLLGVCGDFVLPCLGFLLCEPQQQLPAGSGPGGAEAPSAAQKRNEKPGRAATPLRARGSKLQFGELAAEGWVVRRWQEACAAGGEMHTYKSL